MMSGKQGVFVGLDTGRNGAPLRLFTSRVRAVSSSGTGHVDSRLTSPWPRGPCPLMDRHEKLSAYPFTDEVVAELVGRCVVAVSQPEASGDRRECRQRRLGRAATVVALGVDQRSRQRVLDGVLRESRRLRDAGGLAAFDAVAVLDALTCALIEPV